MITVAELCAHLDAAIPFAWAEEWDRVGLLVGDPSAVVTRVLVTLDATHSALDRATAAGVNVVVTHHPAFLDPLGAVVAAQGSAGVVFEAARRDIALIACHTNLDRSPEGADALARELGLEIVGALECREPDDRPDVPRAGRLCAAPDAGTLGDMAALVGRQLGVGTRIWGDPAARVSRVALAPGSGRSLVDAAITAGADALVTGELRYHVAHDAQERGLLVVEAGHDATEWPLTRALARLVGRADGLSPHDVEMDAVSYPWLTIAKGSECT